MEHFVLIKKYGFSEVFLSQISQENHLEPARVLSQEKGFYRIITDKDVYKRQDQHPDGVHHGPWDLPHRVRGADVSDRGGQRRLSGPDFAYCVHAVSYTHLDVYKRQGLCYL